MSVVAMEQRKKLHPHKFTLWVGIGSLLMMFAGLRSEERRVGKECA